MNQPSVGLCKTLELVLIVLAMAISAHFVHERIVYKDLPSGDEGSWMGTAAELSRGNGFSIRTYEWPFLKPETIPRPNETRFPAFVTVLAAVFKTAGISYSAGLWTVGIIFMLFEICAYFALRNIWGRRTALVSLLAMVFSLNQLYWGTGVCTEALYGLALAGFLGLSGKFSTQGRYHWLFLGIGLGVLWMIRPNTTLFVPGLALYWYLRFRRHECRVKDLALALGVMALICLPWMVRNAIQFGNPMQGAQSAGLFRAFDWEPLNYTLGGFIGKYGVFFPVKSLIFGIGKFFYALDFHEHGLELLPLAGVCIGVVRRKPFYSVTALVGFLLTFLMCAYICYHSWAGIRLFSPFLPFVYAYGIAAIFDEARRLRSWTHPIVRWAWTGGAAALVLGTVVYPHRYYERFYANARPTPFDRTAHFNLLEKELGRDGIYLAGNIGQLNYEREFRCVMMTSFYDSAMTDRMLDRLPPRLVACTMEERTNPRTMIIFDRMIARGLTLDSIAAIGPVVYSRIRTKIPDEAHQ